MYQGEDDVRDDCLQAFRGFKHNREGHAVQCLIAAGTFSIVYLNTLTASPFNVTDFVEDLGFSIDNAIVEGVWAKSNGLVAQLDWCIIPEMP